MTNDDKRSIYKQWARSNNNSPYPHECRDLTCGAKTRAGTPCKQKAIYSNGRCKFHGGLSTGPRTTEGKAKSVTNGFKQSPCKGQDNGKVLGRVFTAT